MSAFILVAPSPDFQKTGRTQFVSACRLWAKKVKERTHSLADGTRGNGFKLKGKI